MILQSKLKLTLVEKLKDYRLSSLLFLCIVLGGTSQYVYDYKLPLYLLSLLFIGVFFSSKEEKNYSHLRTIPMFLLGSFIAAFIFYSIPLAPHIWVSLEGREQVAEGLGLIGQPNLWLPISLHFERTFIALFDFIPVVIVGLIATLSCNSREISLAKGCILLSAIICSILGVLQLLLVGSPINLYEIHNIGKPTAFFSNTNHFACFLAMALPLAFVKLSKPSGITSRSVDNILNPIGVIYIILLILGIILSGSSAGYILVLLVLPICTYILYRNNRKLNKVILSLPVILLMFLLVDFFILSDEAAVFFHKIYDVETASRAEIFKTSLTLQKDFGNFGIGPGAFENAYKIYEPQNTITTKFANNAHNDYLQLWLEFGVLGVIGILTGLFWFFKASIRTLKQNSKTKVNIVQIYLLCIFIPILQSFVDYPFRTITISAVFVFFISLIAREERKN